LMISPSNHPTPETPCAAVHEKTRARCELPLNHAENHRGGFDHGVAQWPHEKPAASLAHPTPETAADRSQPIVGVPTNRTQPIVDTPANKLWHEYLTRCVIDANGTRIHTVACRDNGACDIVEPTPEVARRRNSSRSY
jgi:hypothetical protein